MNNDSFFSIDRLVEFGMGMAVAQQMVQTMNQTMQNMHVPGAGNPIPAPQTLLFYAIIDGKQAGPFSEAEISNLITNKTISKDTYLWKPGMPNWLIAEQIPEIIRLAALTPPPFPIK